MKPSAPGSWKEVGERVARARNAAQLTQAEVAEATGMDGAAIARIEDGSRALDPRELVRLANVLHRAVAWLLRGALVEVASRRGAPGEFSEGRADAEVDALARDIMQLDEAGTLGEIISWRPSQEIQSSAEGQAAAVAARDHLRDCDPALGDGPLRDLARAAERFGLCSYVLDLGPEAPDGIYVPIDERGAVIVNGAQPVGRRRFTLAHELGHHLLADEYAVDFTVLGDEPSEQVINAFAIHFLMPEPGVLAAWEREIGRRRREREAAIVLAAEFGVSWTATIAQLSRFKLVSSVLADELRAVRPKEGEYLELEARVLHELPVPSVSPSFAAAVLRAYRQRDISAARAVEMLRGTVKEEEELPEVADAPLEAILGSSRDW